MHVGFLKLLLNLWNCNPVPRSLIFPKKGDPGVMLLKPHFTIYQKVRLPACGLLWLTCWPVTLLWLHNLGKNDFWKPLEHISFNWFFSHSWSFHKVFNGSGNCQWCILFQWCTAGCPATGRGHNSSLVSTVYILVDLAHKINCEYSLLSVLFYSKQSKTLCRWYRRGQPRQKLTGKSLLARVVQCIDIVRFLTCCVRVRKCLPQQNLNRTQTKQY